jgi:hypothetical protein
MNVALACISSVTKRCVQSREIDTTFLVGAVLAKSVRDNAAFHATRNQCIWARLQAGATKPTGELESAALL